jgi:hypothetical protein
LRFRGFDDEFTTFYGGLVRYFHDENEG